MRRIAHFLVILVLCLMGAVSAAHADKTTTTTTITVERYDNGFGLPDCESSGTGCTVTITRTMEKGSVIAPSGGGFILHVSNTDMVGVVPRGTGPVSKPLVNRAVILPPTTTVTIDDSPSYPFLNGRIINISGIATDVNGGYSVSFLP